ncbi:phage tail assembly chaperone [Oligella urethralis]|uniref:phage tail assembly chaperone n=1 Tax=Oligella urethralis TaxID=90245 RepID=UPI0018CD3616|nr:phage tail assembly chaperone [Oligella urethralis]
MRPPTPEPIEVPETLLNLVEEPEPESEPSAEEQARWRRDGLLYELDVIVTNPLRWGSLTEAEQKDLADYRQALLDVPQQEGFPDAVDWPAKPEFL